HFYLCSWERWVNLPTLPARCTATPVIHFLDPPVPTLLPPPTTAQGFSPSGGRCVDANARCSGIIATDGPNTGYCCYGTRKAPEPIPGGYSCYQSDGGPGGLYCVTTSARGCYESRGSPLSCPSGRSADGSDCVSSVTLRYTCPSGYSLHGTTCFDTYTASTITTSTQCNRASPATDGCQWCSAVSACLPGAAPCPASCLVTPQTTCTNIASTCQWCSAIGVCQKDSIGCFASCLVATADSSICDTSASCKYCTAIGVCQPNAGICYTTCLDATAESNVCEVSTACKYCESIGVCQPNNGACWPTCTPASDDPLSPNLCTTSVDCKWCPTLNYCTERTRDCHIVCTTLAPEEPGICGCLRYCGRAGVCHACRGERRCDWRPVCVVPGLVLCSCAEKKK
ncbi:Hypothetical protein, putative, partial [Bodo saltans]